ncbi:hypothetical protein BDR07DRAFT_107273 [Suillus spraguei]|nr:hypothetical protein BDR07DRAFT_107273 [Suillus spraguei]
MIYNRATEQHEYKIRVKWTTDRETKSKGTHKYRTNRSHVYRRILSKRKPFLILHVHYSTILPVLTICKRTWPDQPRPALTRPQLPSLPLSKSLPSSKSAKGLCERARPIRDTDISSPSPSDASPNDINSSSLVIEGDRELAAPERDARCSSGDSTANGEPERLPLLPRLRTSMFGEEKTLCDEGGESRTGGVGAAG